MTDFDVIFSETDLLLVVDEWKGVGLGEEAVSFQARGFTDIGRSTRTLYELLAFNGAAEWHASGTRAEAKFLFDCPAYEEIMREIEVADTCLYNHLFKDVDVYSDGGPAAAAWARMMREEKSGLAEVWDVRSRHARALFWFIECLLRCLEPGLGRGTRVRIVVDRQDWLTERVKRIPLFAPGLGLLCGRDDSIEAEVFAITQKSEMAVLPYLPFLGLVDSEVWAFGRLLSLKLQDGTTVHQRYMQRRSQAPIMMDDVVIPKPEWDEMFMRYHGRHEHIRDYWAVLSNWSANKNVDINSALRST